MTDTSTTYFIPMMPAPYIWRRDRQTVESWWSWRDGFRTWMKLRGATKPESAFRITAVVRRIAGHPYIPVDDRHISMWTDAIGRAARLWAGREPADVRVSFEPLEGPMGTEVIRKTGVYIEIEEV